MENSKKLCDVSIIIVNWNTRDILRQCLDSIYVETTGLNFEIIVVDNGSTDGSVEMIQQDFDRVRLVANSENKGFATANNQGISTADGRYLLLLNSDTIILDHAIEKVMAFADRHLDAAVVGCILLNPDRTLQISCFMFPSLLNLLLFSTGAARSFPKNWFFGRERMTWWVRDDAREVDVVTGCFMLVRKKAVDEVGPMDERFFMYNEETDWCYRFKKKGWKNWFTSDAEIVHIGGASAAKLGMQRAELQNSSFLLYMFKHWATPKALIGVFLLAFFYVLRLAVLVPRYLVMRRNTDRELAEHFWGGLKNCLFFFNRPANTA